MAFRFELVSPERRLASREAEAVGIPGVEGDLTAMPAHAPFLTVLRPGLVTVTAGGDSTAYFVSGGFAEITPEAVTVLAEEAVERSEVTREMLDRLIAAAEKAADSAGEDTRIAAQQRLSDFRTLAAQLAG
ncbi:MAG: ATP synthase F1 subunit epsilon [Alphaproteobacteria bacterium]|nr:MAG: ATP synthase F1 subunit epsilon [Alphaproteobacteria bacterium]